MDVSVQDYVARQPHINRRRRIVRPGLYGLMRLLCDVHVRGLEHIPASGPVVIMMNHVTFIDPAIFSAVIHPRYVISMAKAETMHHWFERRMVQVWGNFVINRDTVDRDALMTAIELLKHDQALLIAPEGTRNPDGMGAAKSGSAYIAHKADAFVVPAAIYGLRDYAQCWKRLRRATVRVNFGRSFRFTVPDGRRLTRPIREQMTTEAMYQIAKAIPEEYADYRGVYHDIENATTDFITFH